MLNLTYKVAELRLPHEGLEGDSPMAFVASHIILFLNEHKMVAILQ